MTDDLDDRLSRRFEADDGAADPESGAEADADSASDDGEGDSQLAQNAQISEQSQTNQQSQTSQNAQTPGQSQTDQQPQTDQNAQATGNAQNAQNAQASQTTQNVKKEWNVRSFYLDDDLDDDLTMAFKRLDLSVSEAETDLDLQKTRHFYPLVVELGLERLEDMDVGAITDRLENRS